MLTVISGSHRSFVGVSDEASLSLILAPHRASLGEHLKEQGVLLTEKVAELTSYCGQSNQDTNGKSGLLKCL